MKSVSGNAHARCKMLILCVLLHAPTLALAEEVGIEHEETKANAEPKGLESEASNSAFGVGLSLRNDFTTDVGKLKFGEQQYQFESEKTSGLTSVDLTASHVRPSAMVYSYGIELTLEKDLKGSQTSPATWGADETIRSQKFNAIALRLSRVGYRFNAAPGFSVLPSGGLGISYGENKASIESLQYQSKNEISLYKVMWNLTAGCKAEYSVNKYFNPFISADVEKSQNISKGLKQKGDWSYYGLDDELSTALDFKNDLGMQLSLGLNVYL